MVTIKIYSSGTHYGPLKPPATLRYDLRKITNPPKHLRNLDARSKNLREHLLNESDFVGLLETIHNDILREVESLDSAGGTDKETTSPTQHIQQSLDEQESGESSRTANHASEETSLSEASARVAENPTTEESLGDSEILDSEDGPTITVNCFCHLGRHRSASMVEELGRLKWPKNIQLELFHRDIDKDRRKSKKQRRVGKSSKSFHDQEED
ncbi:hypothetical protein H072_3104 [Dactylellina haptotyla CBS 200.50]|uniref:Uncharacterized protein n=1 Tax=Dactylellina haptotyla (strain CBS 200.50) TaxID=1284197 RepID=S8AP95_DACHA|nr:hypothetical protein H072_3104 [Dactylellina haptotyla CBS 200.50]